MSRIPFLLSQLQSTRQYTLQVLDHTPRDLWLLTPPNTPTHIAWHVGHLTISPYAQFIQRIFGETPADAALLPLPLFSQLFTKGTTPDPAAPAYPPLDTILHHFHAIHAHVLARLADFPDHLLDTPILQPHQIAKTRLDMAMWWIKHEMLHTGQIALLRRLHGQNPWR